MPKYHISEDGNPRPCRASKKVCRFGGESAHFESKWAARDEYEELQLIEEFKSKDSAVASVEALGSMIDRKMTGNFRSRSDNGLDLPVTANSNKYRETFHKNILTGNVSEAQKALSAWLKEANEADLNDSWKRVFAKRKIFTKSVIDADPEVLEAHISEKYLRPHAVNPQDSTEVRGALVAKAEGWTVQGPEVLHTSGMKLSMTPGYADTSGWTITGPEGWKEKYFSKNSGLYPLSSYELLDTRALDRVASYGF